MKPFLKILLLAIAIAVVTLVPHSGIIPLPFGYTIPVLIFIWLFLRWQKENFAATGFSFKRFEIKALLTGAVAAILLFAFINYIFFPLLQKIVQLPPGDLGGYNKVRHNTPFYIFIVLMGWIVGGFYEELVFHGFIFTRLEKLFTTKKAAAISFWLSNCIFALYHLQLGAGGVINAFIAGAGYHALMLRYNRNMWYAIFCHAIFDTIALTYIYVGNW